MSWHIIVTNANAERKVSCTLMNKGLTVYYPTLKRPVVYRHEVVIRERAAFSRYIFLELPYPVVKLVNTPGLEYVLKNSEGFYSELDDRIVEEIKQREKNGFFDASSLCAVHDLHAKVIKMAKRGKAVVEVQMFGSTRQATLAV